MEIRYEDYQRLILTVVWKWFLKTGIEFEELEAEGNLVFMECLNNGKYDSKKGSFSTYLYKGLNLRFGNMLKSIRQNLELPEELKDNRGFDLESQVVFKQSLDHLPPKAKKVIHIVLNTPMEMINKGKTKVTKHIIQHYLHDQLGWSYPVIWRTFRTIQNILGEK